MFAEGSYHSEITESLTPLSGRYTTYDGAVLELECKQAGGNLEHFSPTAYSAYARIPLIVDAVCDALVFLITTNMVNNTDFIVSGKQAQVVKSIATYILFALTLYDGILLKGGTFVMECSNVPHHAVGVQEGLLQSY